MWEVADNENAILTTYVMLPVQLNAFDDIHFLTQATAQVHDISNMDKTSYKGITLVADRTRAYACVHS